MTIGVDYNVYQYVAEALAGLEGYNLDDFFVEQEGDYYFFEDWDFLMDLLGLQEQNGAIWAVSMRPSQESQLGIVGYYAP